MSRAVQSPLDFRRLVLLISTLLIISSAFTGAKVVEPFSILSAKKSLSPAQGVSAESCKRNRSLSGGG